jgi:hypothetical protein
MFPTHPTIFHCSAQEQSQAAGNKTRVRALARLSCMCPAHAAWPPRPCATSPSRDDRGASNLPAHFSPSTLLSIRLCSSSQPPSSRTDSDRVIHYRIYPAPSHTCSLVSKPCSLCACTVCRPPGSRVHASRLPTSRRMPCSALRTCALCQCLSAPQPLSLCARLAIHLWHCRTCIVRPLASLAV